MIKVMFVCLGNICRSTMAEAVFRNKVVKAGLESYVHISSAATGSWNIGDQPYEGTRKILDRENISYEGIYASKITAEEFETYDYIIGMDESNVENLKKLKPSFVNDLKICLFLSSIIGEEKQGVPDPYYTGDFELTYKLVNLGTDKWLEKIKQKINS